MTEHPFVMPEPVDRPEGLIETMRWEGAIRLLDYHLARLGTSAQSFGFSYDKRRVERALAVLTQRLKGIHRIRIELSCTGDIRFRTAPLEDGKPLYRVTFARERVDPSDPFLYHKTTRRALYERAYRAGRAQGFDEVLLCNEAGAVTEGTRTNLFVERDGTLYTPPVKVGLLPGVFRAYMLASRPDVVERVLYPEDVLTADRVYVCNALRGMKAVELVA
ncbi:MAG: hypothetical protein D6746_14640 [Bacteroidetes bacterium]|nr:MAG: hypothetical protein D6746_14640 [Bacteroidota bacterium]